MKMQASSGKLSGYKTGYENERDEARLNGYMGGIHQLRFNV